MVYAYYVVYGAFDPNYPNGDPSVLKTAQLQMFTQGMANFDAVNGFVSDPNDNGFLSLTGEVQSLQQCQVGCLGN